METLNEFRTKYKEAFKELMKYTPDQAGNLIWCERMSEMEDKHPVWAEIVENEK